MNKSNFKFVLKITGPKKASLELSGTISEVAKDRILKTIATDFEGKTFPKLINVKDKSGG